MFENSLTYLQFNTTYCGVEHTALAHENPIFATLLKRRRNEVDVEAYLEVSSIESLSKQLKKQQQTCLIVNDDQVLSKTIESSQTDSIQLVNKAYANINIKDFYFEIVSQKHTHFISVSRKTHIDGLIEDYNSKGISITHVSLGNSMLSHVSEHINAEHVVTSNANIKISEGRISSLELCTISGTKSYDVNGLEVDSHHVLSLSGALSLILRQQQPLSNLKEQNQLLLVDHKQARFFTQFSRVALIFILGLLLANFFIFNSYFNKVNALEATSQINQATKIKVLAMNERVLKVEKMVNDMLEGNTSKSSFYINALIQNLPESILLSTLDYQPLLKRIKADQPIEVESAILMISGTSNNSDNFSKWLTQLEAVTWVQKADIIEYGSENNRLSKFTLKITLND